MLPITRRRSLRLEGYDYSQAGAYYVTLVAEGRARRFGQVADANVLLSPAGRMVAERWAGLADHFEGLELDEFVVMPNHLHAVLLLPGGPTGPSLSKVVQGFKSFTTRLYAEGVTACGWPRFDGRLWQRGFYDHVIRNLADLDRVRQYIDENPLAWDLDEENDQRP